MHFIIDILTFILIFILVRISCPSTKTSVTVYTNQACVQLYMGGYLDQVSDYVGLEGQRFQNYSGMCLETQVHPDAINQVRALYPTLSIFIGKCFFSLAVA